MLVIEGYAGKSLEVAKYIDSLGSQSVLIISCDDKAFNGLSKNNVFYYTETDIKNIVETIGFYTFKHIIFYQNVKREDIDTFKRLEGVFGLEAVLTVQTPDSENPREVTMYNV